MKQWSCRTIKLEYIIEYVQNEGDWAVLWLKEFVRKEMPPNKNGKPRQVTLIEISNEFAEHFMHELMPPAKEKDPSMYDSINNL